MSRPLQIALLAALGFAVLWFIALRPQSDSGGGSSAPATPAKASPANPAKSLPGKSLPGGLGTAVDKARNAQAQENSAAHRSDQASNNLDAQQATKLSPTPVQTAPAKTAPAKSPAAVPAPVAVDTSSPGFKIGQSIGRSAANSSPLVSAPAAAVGLFFGSVVGSSAAKASSTAAKVSAPARVAAPARKHVAATRGSAPAPRASASPDAVNRALAGGKVVVLLFWSNRSSDDQAVHGELSQVATRGGRVFVASAPIRDVSRYSAITSGIDVLQSPTIVVVDRLRHATLLTGYTDHTEIDQSVAGALAAR